MVDEVKAERVRELERRLADLEARMPAHSVPPAMMIELDDLEEELARLELELDHGE